MRILLTSDLHYRLKQYDWLIGAAPRFDAVVVAGDHIDSFLHVPTDVQIAALSATFAEVARASRLLVCSGNHDLDARHPHGEKMAGWIDSLRGEGLAVDGDTVRQGDTLFTICPWWDGPLTRESVGHLLDAAAAQRKSGDRWVWIHHAPPECSLSWNGKRHYGDSALPELIARHRPDAVLCGHIHEAPFKNGGSWVDRMGSTWLFNAGHQIGEVPARVEIDLDAKQARWVSIAGVEEQSLA